MAVGAVVVVDGEHVCPLLAQNGGEPAGGLVEIGPPEGPRAIVLRRPHHARVDVTQHLAAGHAQHGGGLLELGGAAIRQPLALPQHALDDLAVLALRRCHEDHAVALGGGLGHDPSGGDGLVVGVGVEGDQG